MGVGYEVRKGEGETSKSVSSTECRRKEKGKDNIMEFWR